MLAMQVPKSTQGVETEIDVSNGLPKTLRAAVFLFGIRM